MEKTFTRSSIGLLLVLVFFAACKKEEKVEIPKDFPVVLDAERWEIRAETRLFSNNMEIRDPSVIQAYEEREGLKELFEVAFDQADGSSGIRFESEAQARFFTGTEEGELFDINRKGTRFLFYSRDSYWINPLAPPAPGSLGYFHSMLKYSDGLGQPNVSGERSTKAVWVAHGNFKVLKLSAFAYVLNTRTGTIPDVVLSRNQGVLYNEFDITAIKYLKMADTLAVKEYAVIYALEH